MEEYNPEIETLLDIIDELQGYVWDMHSILELIYQIDAALPPLMPNNGRPHRVFLLSNALRYVVNTVRHEILVLSEKLEKMDALPEKKKEGPLLVVEYEKENA